MGNEAEKLAKESTSRKKGCNWCAEASLEVGKGSGYGIVIYRIGDANDGWFATLSPKTGGDPKKDFTVQLMPCAHLTHFSQMDSFPGLAENYGIAFSKLSKAMTTVMMKEGSLKAEAAKREEGAAIAAYGKSTTWSEKKEHLHIKLFPFRGAIGQPYTVDSSFGKKESFRDSSDKEFVKMEPVRKVMLAEERFNKLAKELIALLKE